MSTRLRPTEAPVPVDCRDKRQLRWPAVIAPGILVAAAGVGAGDLLTASIAGSTVGLAILWAAPMGCVLKWTLNEGIARWQMATQATLLEGWITHLGRWIQWVFLLYFTLWSFFVGGALITACGVAGTSMIPLGDPNTSKIVWGTVHSLAGMGLVWVGGFRLFQKLMGAFVAFKFIAVIVTAVFLVSDWRAVLHGLTVPSIPPQGLPWILGVLGGVGGTVTLLSYGYWIREQGRTGEGGVRVCRLDLAIAYTVTAVFGVAMIIIGSRIHLEGQGIRLAGQLAEQLALVLGQWGKWVFLLGFWGAVFGSLIAVWQSAPYLFADFLLLRRSLEPSQHAALDLKRTRAYRGFLVGISLVPLVNLWLTVERIQLAYAVMGAAFMPLLAITLLILNNSEWVGKKFRNHWLVNCLLLVTVLLFAYIGLLQVLDRMPSFGG